MRTVFPTGVTLYEPDQCFGGYTILWRGTSVRLVDMNGRTAHEWNNDIGGSGNRVVRARLLPNGHVLIAANSPTLQTEMMSQTGLIRELDWDGNIVFDFVPEGTIPHENLLGPHHDVFRKTNGNTLLICREEVPKELMYVVEDPARRDITLYGDAVLEVTSTGAVVWEWHAHDHLDLNLHSPVVRRSGGKGGEYSNTASDWTHLNTVQALPENRWFDNGDRRFAPGNVLISPRCLDTIFVIDHDTGEVTWSYSGDYCGGLSGQHEPHMIEKGIPGEGNILIFDNGASPCKDLYHCGCSFILEVDPVAEEEVWVYDKGPQLFSKYTSSCQRLGNGNTLICDSGAGRVFEVTHEGKTVWEHVEGCSRAYRYPYDYCPQLAARGEPAEMPVRPPKDFHVPPQLLQAE